MGETRNKGQFDDGDLKLDHFMVAFHHWLIDPRNMKVIFWSFVAGMTVTSLLMIGFGVLDEVIPSNMDRGEAINQVINGFFTFLILCLHPERCLHSYMLYRWEASDQITLRELYCKNGTRKPNEWIHLMIVLVLLQLNCIGQYVLCYLNLHYNAADRLGTTVAFWLVITLGAAIGAGVYNYHSPLGREFDMSRPQFEDEESGSEILVKL